jgi:hypothetical protein
VCPQVPAILLCQEFDELKVPSSPPRRLSRSSIDLRDLEAQHEREKIMSQNVSESVSSIYHCFDNSIRYSGSEPINAHIKALENQFSSKAGEVRDGGDDKKTSRDESQKSSVNNFSFMNNLEHSITKENDMNLISSASIIKDNQVNANGCSINNTNKKSFKKKMLASSDSDFFSLLRYNSEKLRRMNCFSIGTNNGSNGNKPKNMIYALSDSDFLIGVSDKNKTLHLNNERKMQAIVNKSDIFNYLNKSFDHKNLLENNFAQHNQNNKKLSDVDGKKQFDNLDFFNMDKLKKVFEESKFDSEKPINGDEKSQKKETVSLPPIVNSTSSDMKLKLNNSRSIDTVLLNIKNNTDKLCTFKLLYDFSPKAINQQESLTKNLLKDATQHPQNINNNNNNNNTNVDTSNVNANTCNNGNNANSFVTESISILKPVNLNEAVSTNNGQQNLQDISTDSNNGLKYCDTMNPATFFDERNITKRKRTASNVTYNVNVIDFQAEDEIDAYHSGGGYGKRSNSSTSKYNAAVYVCVCVLCFNYTHLYIYSFIHLIESSNA